MKQHVVLPSRVEKRIGRPHSATPCRTFVLAESRPAIINYHDALVTIEGTNPADLPAEFAWGIHGNRSMADASIYFSKAAAEAGKLLYEVELWMSFNALKESTTSVTEELVRNSGLLASTRLRADYEEEVKEVVMSYLDGRLSAKDYKAASALKLQQLLVQFPSAVWRFMRERPYVKAFIHQAMVRVAEKNGRRDAVAARLNVITFRPDPKRIVEAVVRQDAEIKVSL